MPYTLAGITITDGVSNGVKYLTWGDASWPTIVYLHGVGERGTDPYKILNQSPIKRRYFNGAYEWNYPLFFNQGFRIVCPLLTASESLWSTAYVDNFLNGMNITTSKGLMGWSLGGGGVCRYLNQAVKTHTFKFGVSMCTGGYNTAGTNVNAPMRFVHAVNDTTSGATVSYSDGVWAGIPAQYQIEYNRPAGGGHFVWESFVKVETGIFDWMASLCTTEVIEEVASVVWDGTNFYAVSSTTRRLIG